MKLLPILLLNVVTVGAGIFIYDQVRTDSADPTEYGVLDADDSALEKRVAALERRAQDNAPMLTSDGGNANLVARLDELERKFERAPTAVVEESEDEQPRTASNAGSALPSLDNVAEPTPEDVAKYRKLQEAAREAERLERERRRIDETLTRLEINLSDVQKDKLAQAFTSFQDRRREVFSSVRTKANEIRESGGEPDWRQLMTEAQTTAQNEFTIKISSFIPEADAQKISEGLNTRGGRGGMMGGRRGGR